MKKIGVLASGGDAPGMNAAIRAVTRTALFRGAEVWGFWDGYNGLLDHRVEELTTWHVAGSLRHGGSIIGAGRCEPFLDADVRIKAVEELREDGFEGLVVIGGEGSMQGAWELHKLGMPTVCIPATIDNDMPGTEITIGADTAINTAMEAIDRLQDTAAAHRRAMIVEVMGRQCGYIAIMAGLASGAEMVITPERPMELEGIFEEMRQVWLRGKRHFIIVLAEGARWGAAELAQLINESDKPYDARYTVLGYIQRGGVPTRFDRILGTRMGVKGADALLDGASGALVCWRNNRSQVLPIDELPPRGDPWDEMLGRVHAISTM
ncbi:MAG: ATP-dependent 6-phosphofructokinase [Chloroflexi bacterium]|nr:ATP-dependent 6-phosphofructokinase [Chloroflexota bacterium]